MIDSSTYFFSWHIIIAVGWMLFIAVQ